MDVTGRVGIWPTGSNFIQNNLVQIYIKINEKRFFFSNYVKDKDEMDALEKLVSPLNLEIVHKGSWDLRKDAVSALKKYAESFDLIVYSKYQLFVKAVEWNLEENKKEKTNDDSSYLEKEI